MEMVQVEQHDAEYGNDTKKHPASQSRSPPGFHLPELTRDSILGFPFSWGCTTSYCVHSLHLVEKKKLVTHD